LVAYYLHCNIFKDCLHNCYQKHLLKKKMVLLIKSWIIRFCQFLGQLLIVVLSKIISHQTKSFHPVIHQFIYLFIHLFIISLYHLSIISFVHPFIIVFNLLSKFTCFILAGIKWLTITSRHFYDRQQTCESSKAYCRILRKCCLVY